jgi:hypothetical protein
VNWEEVLNALGEGVLVLKGSEVAFANHFLVENQLVREDWKGKHYYEAIKSLPFISIVGRALGKDSLSEEFQHLEPLLQSSLKEDRRAVCLRDFRC